VSVLLLAVCGSWLSTLVEGQSCTGANAPPANGQAGSCTATLASGSSCQVVCNNGYNPSGTSSCLNGVFTSATCRENPCDASTPPANGEKGNCTTPLAAGSVCQPVCNRRYRVSGTSLCRAGAVAAAHCFRVDVAERAALQLFYNATDGPNWHRSDGWSLNSTGQPFNHTDHCTWEGVACEETNGAVIKLDLEYNRLKADLTPTFADLPELTQLYLNGNIFTSWVLKNLTALTQLKVMQASVNA